MRASKNSTISRRNTRMRAHAPDTGSPPQSCYEFLEATDLIISRTAKVARHATGRTSCVMETAVALDRKRTRRRLTLCLHGRTVVDTDVSRASWALRPIPQDVPWKQHHDESGSSPGS